MRPYAQIVERHWRTFRPTAVAEMEDPQAFFQATGARVETQVREMTEDLLAKWPPEKGLLERQAQIGQAQRQAEEVVMANEVFLPPEPDAMENELPTDGLWPIPPMEHSPTEDTVTPPA